MGLDVVFYEKKNGKRPVEEFITRLPAKERAFVTGSLANITQLGFDTPRINFRQIKGSLWEIKLKDNRIFYVGMKDNRVVLLHAYKKKSPKAPMKEIVIALVRMREVQRK